MWIRDWEYKKSCGYRQVSGEVWEEIPPPLVTIADGEGVRHAYPEDYLDEFVEKQFEIMQQ